MDNKAMMQLHEKLKLLRLHIQLSRPQLAKKLNVTRQCISAYELGKRKPTISIIARYIDLASKHDVHLGIQDFLQ